MNPIQHVIESTTVGQAVSHETLTIFPLLANEAFAKDHLTLDEALAAGTATITEVSESGSVPELLFRNKGDKAVFLLDGEELVGAKQNRILNITILAPAMKDTVIPVSCVEAGRWSHSRPDFQSASRVQFSESRARRSAHVSDDIMMCRERRSDQGEVWRDIDQKLHAMRSDSPTRAVESAFVDHETRIAEYVKKLGQVDLQRGAVFAINGRIAGMELFDSEQTCGALLPKVIRSYALDAIDPRIAGEPRSDQQPVEAFLERVIRAKCHEDHAIGEGVDLRFQGDPGLAGGALFARDRVVHLVAFALRQHTMRSSDRVYRRRAFRS